MLVRKGCPDSQRIGKRITYVGDIFRKGDHYLQVTSIEKGKRVEVECLSTGWRTQVFSAKLHQEGGISHPFKRTVMGHGFVGIGGYSLSESNASGIWRGMLRRSYDKLHRSYQGSIVSEEWHNYQNFAKWYYSQYRKEGVNYDIDKDVLTDDKIYSSNTSLLIPSYVNRCIVDKVQRPVKIKCISGWFSYGRFFDKKNKALDYSYFCKSEYLLNIISYSLKNDEIDLSVCLKLINYVKRKFPYDISF